MFTFLRKRRSWAFGAREIDKGVLVHKYKQTRRGDFTVSEPVGIYPLSLGALPTANNMQIEPGKTLQWIPSTLDAPKDVNSVRVTVYSPPPPFPRQLQCALQLAMFPLETLSMSTVLYHAPDVDTDISISTWGDWTTIFCGVETLPKSGSNETTSEKQFIHQPTFAPSRRIVSTRAIGSKSWPPGYRLVFEGPWLEWSRLLLPCRLGILTEGIS